jgi:hypothetical protein
VIVKFKRSQIGSLIKIPVRGNSLNAIKVDDGGKFKIRFRANSQGKTQVMKSRN